MKRKDELKIEILSNIKDEIIDKQSSKRYALMNRKRKPKWIIPSSVAAVLLIAIMIPLFIVLFSKQVPVYEGMTVSSTYQSSTAEVGGVAMLSASNSGRTQIDFLKDDNGNHNGHYKKPVEDIVDDEFSSSLTVPEQHMYYANPSQDIYITVHISNPDSFEILSFTLNGKKYSSYMFEDGSDMENLILKVTVPAGAEGITEYTIDAIKYVDGTAIKDVRMEGNRTVKVGVYTAGRLPTVRIDDEIIGINDISFTASINDRLDLIKMSEGNVFVVICDNSSVVYKQELNPDEVNNIKFDSLIMDTTYRYAIVANYDSLDGSSFSTHILYEKEFTTKNIVAFKPASITQESISFTLEWEESFENKVLDSLALYKGEEKVRELDVNTTSIDGLLSNNEYRLVATYTNKGETETSDLIFTTQAKATPEITITETSKTQTSLGFDISITDVDNVGAITKLELIHGEDVQNIIDLSTRELTSLLSNNTYTVKVTYTYDLNDGVGKQTIEKTVDITTEAKAEPKFTFKNMVSEMYSIRGEYDITNIDNTLLSYKVEFYCGDELVKENTDKEIAFDSLDYYTDYTVKITYTFDVSDGKGVQTKGVEQSIKTAPYVDIKDLSIKNTSTVFTNEYIYLVATLENPVGVTVKAATINGTEYSANGASSGNMLLVDIKNEGQFANGEVALSIERLYVTIDGNDYTIDVTTACSDTVSVYSRLTILNAEIVNKDLERFDWISTTVNDDETKRYLLITLDGAKSNDIKTIHIDGRGEEGGSELSIDFNNVELVDNTHVLVPLQDMVYYDRLGLSTFTLTINCESSYGGSYEVTCNTPDIYVVADVKYISTAEEFINCPRDVYAELTCDLDFSGISGFEGKYFEGVFNGNGYSIKNVSFMGDYSDKDIGIFTKFNGFLRNLNIENLFMYVSGGNNAAALIAMRGSSMGYAGYAKVENCTIDENSVISISNTVWNSAIFCGWADKIDFINCVNYANANLHNPCDYGVPGFIGGNSDNFEFTDCYNYGTITSNGEVFYDPNAQEQPEE